MWFIGVEVEQETSAPPPKKILDPPLIYQSVNYRRVNQQIANKVVEIGGKNITCQATTK